MEKMNVRYRKIKIILISLILIVVGGCIENDENKKIENIKSDNNNVNDSYIKFIIVGDPHIKSTNSSNRGNERLIEIVKFINNQDIDFVVFLGDITDDGKDATFKIAQEILSNIEKPYYVVVGNHDILENKDTFQSFFGPTEHIEYIKDYQLLFIGMYDEEDENGKKILHWSFNFSNVNKSIPTLVFIHGPTRGPPPECGHCNWGKKFFGYALDIQSELDRLNLIGVYSGHVHYNSDQTINKVRHITINGLVTKKIGNISVTPSDEIGYVKITENTSEYKLLNYRQERI